MANFSSSPEEFPPLSSKVSSLPSGPALSYNNIVAAPRPGNAFQLSSSTAPDDPLDFNEPQVKATKDEWGLSLIGYSIGRRPYYESLLSATRKVWKLKGMMKLLSLSDGFFMLKFSAHEDYDMALAGGVWFFLGKPFVLQKWVPNFKPVREEFTSIPIWFKIIDLPLPCWTPDGISRIASKIGKPLAVDDLTAEQTRLTYARVCVQVSKDCAYPETIPITILGEPFTLKIQYEWKPLPCQHCGSIVHTPDFCPSKPPSPQSDVQIPSRGRSNSRKPPKPSQRNSSINSAPQNNPSTSSVTQQPPAQIPAINNQISANSIPATSQPSLVVIPPNNIQTTFTNIPNLNSPTDEVPITSSIIIPQQQDKVISPNKFALLEESNVILQTTSSSSSQEQTRNVSQAQPKASRSKAAKKTPNHHTKSQ
ncbi:Uncharacterized protein MA16_Dca022735 [Dendrobium catenatum]|uniref:DUF4283 domain-containing protein n=1 Tax=Dendrobium catenatum TaxID=906689 RepID=A0A2I0VK05_9ASPA|nr:Uncharacterized protein MA16_Dca022735 [Dendrobium catenatum]